jgi:hypothetical protein
MIRDPQIANVANSLSAVGLVLVKSQQVGSGISTVSVTDAFSSKFDHYKVTYIAPTSPTYSPDFLWFHFADVAEYETQAISMAFGSIDPFGDYTNYWYAGYSADNVNYINIDVFNPYSSQPKMMTSTFKISGGLMTAFNSNSTTIPYTGFTIGNLGGDFNGGTICVYGYKN